MPVRRPEVRTLAEVDAVAEIRQSCGNGELDRVLGGGLVKGSVTLIGGDPGIGKSTLLLQVLAELATRNRTLYVSGEESPQQISLRAQRLGLPRDRPAAAAGDQRRADSGHRRDRTSRKRW
jgi:DNA repair protein RadA/Sms